LSAAVDALEAWLANAVEVKTWLPSINREVTIHPTRAELIKISGNISKHNFTRLTRTSRWLKDILAKEQVNVDALDVLQALDDFYGRFHDDVLNYHSSTMAQLLNDVRWGVHEYLLPEYTRALRDDSSAVAGYSFDIPQEIQHPFAQTCYWDLMYGVRGKPYVARFKVPAVMLRRY